MSKNIRNGVDQPSKRPTEVQCQAWDAGWPRRRQPSVNERLGILIPINPACGRLTRGSIQIDDDEICHLKFGHMMLSFSAENRSINLLSPLLNIGSLQDRISDNKHCMQDVRL